ncbi:MAG: hypothetical protein IJA19_01595 [Clostridia bacterium]|nr:hypothetical protein [Clostridia bacterium]MBQ9997529.1 hypothetical protein [Clostridia bacterium]
MTIKQAIDIAYSYAKIASDSVPKALMRHFADSAQKEIALNTFYIQKRFMVNKKDTKPLKIVLPDENVGFARIIRRGSALPINYTVTDSSQIIIEDYGQFDIYFNILPKTIDLSTDDDYSFEVNIKTHGAIPFYIASKIAKDPRVAETCFYEWNSLNCIAKSYQNSNKEYNKYYL